MSAPEHVAGVQQAAALPPQRATMHRMVDDAFDEAHQQDPGTAAHVMLKHPKAPFTLECVALRCNGRLTALQCAAGSLKTWAGSTLKSAATSPEDRRLAEAMDTEPEVSVEAFEDAQSHGFLMFRNATGKTKRMKPDQVPKPDYSCVLSEYSPETGEQLTLAQLVKMLTPSIHKALQASQAGGFGTYFGNKTLGTSAHAATRTTLSAMPGEPLGEAAPDAEAKIRAFLESQQGAATLAQGPHQSRGRPVARRRR